MDSGNGTILASDWGGLSDFLIAKFYEVDEEGIRLTGDGARTAEVHAPITDGNREMALNWQSPFEATSPGTKAPAINTTALVRAKECMLIEEPLRWQQPVANGLLFALRGSPSAAVSPRKSRSGTAA